LDHPDFPDHLVEIGGFAPYARSNPPEFLLEGLMARQAKFLTDLAGRLPRLGVRKVELKSLGASVYDLRVQIENTGYLPTAMAQGDTTREVFPVRIVLEIPGDSILTGSRRVDLGTIPGSGGMKEARWVFLGKDLRDVTFEAVSMLGGRLRRTLELNEAK
jgi:hypothetical protein